MRTLTRWAGLVSWLACGAQGCVDSEGISFPEAPGPYRSRIFAVECGGESAAWALGDEQLPPLLIASCDDDTRYFAAFYEAELETLGLLPGLVPFGPCPPEAGIRCAEDQLPIPDATRLFTASRSVFGARSEWRSDGSSWPPSLGERPFARTNRCPNLVKKTVHVSGYHRFGGVFVDEERLVLIGDPVLDRPMDRATHFFETTLTELRNGGLTGPPTATLAEFRASELAAAPATTEIFAGVGNGGFLLRGHVEEGLRREPHPMPERETPRIALQPGSDTHPVIAVRDPDFPGEISFYRDGDWDVFDGTPAMVGTCAPFRAEGQRGSMFWLDERELLAMPHAQDWSKVVVRTATNSPDGYWHVTDGEAVWRRVGVRDANDCVGLMANLGSLGLVAITRDPKFYRHRGGTWEPLAILRLPQMPFDDVIRATTPIRDGFAYTRQGRRFGYVVDRVSCQELALDDTELDEMITNGRTLIVFGDAPGSVTSPEVPTGPSSLHIIDFEEPGQ